MRRAPFAEMAVAAPDDDDTVRPYRPAVSAIIAWVLLVSVAGTVWLGFGIAEWMLP